MRYLIAGLAVFFALVLLFLLHMLNKEKWKQKEWEERHPAKDRIQKSSGKRHK